MDVLLNRIQDELPECRGVFGVLLGLGGVAAFGQHGAEIAQSAPGFGVGI